MSGTRAATLMAAVTPAEVRALRVARRQTVTAAAASIGVSRRTWHRWESGHVPPDPRAVREYEHSVPVVEVPVVDALAAYLAEP